MNTEPLYWNVPIPTKEGAISAFHGNDKLLKLRKNSNRLIHEVLAFAPEDSHKLDYEKMQVLTMEYLRLRANHNIAYAQAHFDKDHYHVHIAISPNEYKSNRVTNLNNKTYYQIRRDLENYQRQQFPELEASIVFLSGKKKEKAKTKNIQEKHLKNRIGENLTTKERLSQIVINHFENSTSKEQFLDLLLSEDNIEPYKRGNAFGIKYGKQKFRLRALGISDEKFRELIERDKSEIQDRLQKLQSIQKEKSIYRKR